MTIRDLLNKINKEKPNRPNSFSEADLIAFANELEAEVADQLGMSEAPQYMDNHTDLDIDLLVPAPYDRLYVSYVKAQIDYANEEYDSYANNQAQHVQDFQDFVDWVVRTGQSKKPFPHRFRNITRW